MGKKGNSSKNEKISKLRDQYGITIKQAKIIIEKYKGSVDDFYKKYKNGTITDTEEMELGACILMKEYGISVYDIPRSHVKKIIEKYGSVDSFYKQYISGSITDEEEQKLVRYIIKKVANTEGIPDSPYDSLYEYISESSREIPGLRIYSIERLKAIIDKINKENKPLGKYTYKEILEAVYDLEGFWEKYNNKYKDEYYDEDRHNDKDDSESSEEKQKYKKYKEIRENPDRLRKLRTIKKRLLRHPISIQYRFLFEIISDEDKEKMQGIIKDIQLQNGDFHENMELLYSIINEKKSEIIHYFDGLNFDYRIIERLLNGHPEIKDRVKARSVIKDIISKNEDLDKRVKYGRYTIDNLLKAFSINIARIEYLGFEHDQAKIIASMIIDGLLVSKGKDEFLKMNFCELMRMKEDDYLWNKSKGGNQITVEDAIKLEDISLNPDLVKEYGADIREICGLILQFLAFEISDVDMLKIPKLSGDDLAKIAEKLRNISYGLDDGKYVIHRGREDDE